MQFVLDDLRQGTEPMSADDAAAQAVKTAPSVAKVQAANEQARQVASEALVAVYPRVDLLGQYTHLSKTGPIEIRVHTRRHAGHAQPDVDEALRDQPAARSVPARRRA